MKVAFKTTIGPLLARSGQKAGPPNQPRAKNLKYDLTDTCINEAVTARTFTYYYMKIMPLSAFCIQIDNDQEA